MKECNKRGSTHPNIFTYMLSELCIFQYRLYIWFWWNFAKIHLPDWQFYLPLASGIYLALVRFTPFSLNMIGISHLHLPCCTGGQQLPTAVITNSQHGERRSRYLKIFAIHANIKHTFRGLGSLYNRITCFYWTLPFDFTCRDVCG